MSCLYPSMSETAQGRFIVIEGPEGAGKSTQTRRLGAALEGMGHGVVLTYEPGGTPTADAIRRLFLSGEHTEITPLTELFLICASRAQHVAEVIRPALDQGRVVICDRFSPSTTVYQGLAGGVPMETVRAMDEAARQGLLPDLTLILDVPADVGLERGLAEDAADRMEGKGLGFHRRVRDGYMQYAQSAQEPCVVIGGEASEDEVAEEVLHRVLECLAATSASAPKP